MQGTRSMGQPANADENAECVNCGHPRQVHADTRATQSETGNDRACMSPEDGTPCDCAGFKPV
jgi:ribosomal protein L37E